jgi:RND superfamily putative drug exporter
MGQYDGDVSHDRLPVATDADAGNDGVFGRVGRIVVRWPLLVIAAWIVLAAGLTQAFPSLGVLAQKAPSSMLPPEAPSLISSQQIADAFKEAGSDNILLVVLSNEKGLSSADEGIYRNLTDTLRADTENVAAIQDFVTTPPLKEILASKDGKAWLLPVNIVGLPGTPQSTEATRIVIETVRSAVANTDLTANMTGPAGTLFDVQEIGERDRIRIETATVVGLLAILLMVYRNPITMMLPLVTIGVSLVTANGVVAAMGTAGLGISNQTIVLLTAIMAGAGTDYAVFIISRYHDYLRFGYDSDSAVRNALSSVGKVVTASAATVAVTFLGMIFTKLSVFSTIGVALATAIAVGCLGALTFLPSLLVLVGRRGWIKPRRDLTNRMWKRSAIRIVRRPVSHLVVSLLILLALAGAASLAYYNYDDRKALPASTESIRGYDAIARHFSINASLPQYILIQSPQDLRTPKALADMEEMARRVSQLPDIDIIRGITRPSGRSLEQAQLSFQAGEVGSRIGQASGVINSNTSRLDQLAGGAGQIADVLGTVRGRLGQSIAAVSVLAQALTTLQNQFGGGQTLAQFDSTNQLLTTIHNLGDSLGMSVSDAVTTFSRDIDPVLKALNASQVCDADPACAASRSRLQQAAAERDNGTLDRIAQLAAQLQAVQANQTLGTTANTVTSAFDSVNQALQSAGISSPTDVSAQLAQLSQGVTTLADGSRQVAEGVQLLVDQTKNLGAGLDQASSFLLGMKQNATTPAMAGFYIPSQVLSGDEFKKAAAIFISSDGRTARYLVQTKLNPFSPEAMDQVNAIVSTAQSSQPNTTLADSTISMSGFSVTLRDIRDYYYRDLRLIVITTILVVLVILIVLLRALVAPLYLILSVILSYLSALGIGILLFQVVLNQPLHWSVPGMTFIILVAVGADYNLLLISRIRDESGVGIRSGVIRTVSQTGGVITAAGLIFTASMLGLLFSSISTLVQMGFVIGIGILLDTFLVRTITVPATAVLVGKANWWPSRSEPEPEMKPIKPVGEAVTSVS